MPGILYNERDLRYSRRRIVGSALVLASGVMLGRSAAAQDENAEIVPIQSTELGPMPTTGTIRGGFVGDPVAQAGVTAGIRPIALVIEQAQIDAEVEVQQIVDGVMLNPSGP